MFKTLQTLLESWIGNGRTKQIIKRFPCLDIFPLSRKKMKAKGMNESNTYSSKYEHYAKREMRTRMKTDFRGDCFQKVVVRQQKKGEKRAK